MNKRKKLWKIYKNYTPIGAHDIYCNCYYGEYRKLHSFVIFVVHTFVSFHCHLFHTSTQLDLTWIVMQQMKQNVLITVHYRGYTRRHFMLNTRSLKHFVSIFVYIFQQDNCFSKLQIVSFFCKPSCKIYNDLRWAELRLEYEFFYNLNQRNRCRYKL